MVMSSEFSLPPTLPRQHFSNTAELRQAVVSKGDEYSDYERSILVEINMLREDPIAYSFIVESEATVGYPYVRDDPAPAHCSEMTLEQLRVYIGDFNRERTELKGLLQKIQREWAETEASMKERWSAEDAERAKKSKRATSGSRRTRSTVIEEEDYMVERQRMAQGLQEAHSRRVNEANLRLLHLERSCRWATDGANAIIKCVQELREAQAVPGLEYSRSLTLAARDVGNECNIAIPTPKVPISTMTPSLPRLFSSPCLNTANDEEPLRPPRSVSLKSSGEKAETPPPPPPPQPQMEIEPQSSLRQSSVNKLNDINGLSSSKNSNIRVDVEENILSVKEEEEEEEDEETLPSSLEVYTTLTGHITLPSSSAHEFFSDNELLRKTTQKACGRYGYYSGALRGMQLCSAFAPRKTLIQMLLGSRVPQFTLLAPNATRETCGLSSSSLSKQTKGLILWANGRLLGCGWVRAKTGAVSVTILIATSFEELGVIHQCHDFSLPQIHRILNRHFVVSQKKGESQQAVLDIHSSLDVKVTEPVTHPIFLDKEKRVVRIVVCADPSVVELTATVTSALDPIPSVPFLDRELLLVQRSKDNIAEVEILLDAFAARRRWLGHPLLVHLFERNNSTGVVGPFKNIGFVRVTPTRHVGDLTLDSNRSKSPPVRGHVEATMFRPPPVLARQRYEGPMEVTEEPQGWPLVTADFQERCATIIEPLNGMWIALDERQHVAIQIPYHDYLRTFINNVVALLKKEETYLKWGDAVGCQERTNQLIISTEEKLNIAEKELEECGAPLQQELIQLQKAIAKKRGKELAKIKKQESEIQQRLHDMEDNIEGLRQELASAREELVQIRREYTLRSMRYRKLKQEYERLCERTDRTKPLCVNVMLVPEDTALRTMVECTQLHPTNATNTIYEADVRVVKGFKGRAVLFVNGQEAVQWEVQPGL